jgi:WD40 repeat protein
MLGAYLAHLQQPSQVPAPPTPRRRRSRGSWPSTWVLLAVSLVGLSLLALAGLHFIPPGRPRVAPPGHPIRLRANLGGPHSPILGAAFTPGSETLAVACDDGAIVVWDLAASSPRTVLLQHTSRVWCVAFSPDGRFMASAGGSWSEANRPGELKLWDAVTGQLLASLTGHTGPVFSVAFSPDNTALISAGWDRTVRLWDVGARKLWMEMPGHKEPVRSVAFSPDGAELASGSFDGSVRLWNARTGRERLRLDCGKYKVNSVAYSGDGRLLATAENLDQSGAGETSDEVPRQAGQVRLRDAWTGEVKKVLRGARGRILSLCFSPDSKTLATGGGHWRDFGEVILWDVASGKERLHLHGHREWVECVNYSPDGDTLVSAGGTLGSQGEMKWWDLRSGVSGPALPLRLRPAVAPAPVLPPRGEGGKRQPDGAPGRP